MSRNIRDLREIINMSRLSFHEEDDFQCNFSSDEDESSSLDGYIASRPSSALGTRSSFRTLSSASASLNNNNITTSKIPPLSVSCSEQEIRPSIVLIGSHHQHNHQTITDSSSKQILNSHTKQFPSHYTPVPPICHNKDGKYIKQTPGNQSRRRRRRTNFDEVLSYLDSVIVNEWLEECNRTINKLNMFATDGHTVVRFFNFLLDEMKYEDYCDLLDMEYSIMFDRLRYGFHAGFAINKLNNNDLAQLATSVLPEYPDRFKRREGVENLLNVFMVLSSSDKADGYRELLKKVNCTTLNKQYIQWLLAIRAHGLINFVSGILRFYENITQTASSSVTCNLVQGECSLTHLVCCSITAGKIKVLDYLNRNYCFSLDEILDVRGRSLLFLAIECENEAVYYLCQVSKKGFLCV